MTFRANALLGWSPARYITGIPSGRPDSSPPFLLTRPCSENEGRISGTNDGSIPASSNNQLATLFSLKSHIIPSERPDGVVTQEPVSFIARKSPGNINLYILL